MTMTITTMTITTMTNEARGAPEEEEDASISAEEEEEEDCTDFIDDGRNSGDWVDSGCIDTGCVESGGMVATVVVRVPGAPTGAPPPVCVPVRG